MAKQPQDKKAETRSSTVRRSHDGRSATSMSGAVGDSTEAASEGNPSDESKQKDSVRTPSDEMFHAAFARKKLAIKLVKALFPDKVKYLDLKGLIVEPNDFYSETLKRRIADLIYTIPTRSSSGGVLKVVIILEHKGQSSPRENKSTIAQMATYVAEFCRHEANKPTENPGLPSPHPIPVVIYTGPDETFGALNWSDYFRIAEGFDEFEMILPIKVVNMTSLRLTGALPKAPELETIFGVMTLRDKTELVEYAPKALLPLARLKRRWTPDDRSLVRQLLHFYKEHARSLRVQLAKEDVRALIDSGNLEEKMEQYPFYEYIAPDIVEEGRVKGLEEGLEKGLKKGREEGRAEERAKTLGEQRNAAYMAVNERFGDVPPALTRIVDNAQNVETLFDMRLYALTKANSLADILSFAETSVF